MELDYLLLDEKEYKREKCINGFLSSSSNTVFSFYRKLELKWII